MMLKLKATVFDIPTTAKETDVLEDDVNISREDIITLTTPQEAKWGRIKHILLGFPDEEYWKILIALSSLVNFFAGTTCFFLARQYLRKFIPVYLICDLLCFINLILLSVHLFWKELRKKMATIKVNKCSYILDIITLLPQELIVIAISGDDTTPAVYMRWITYVRLKSLLVFIEKLRGVLEKRWRNTVFLFVIILSVTFHLSSCVIYEISCHHLRCVNNFSGNNYNNTSRLAKKANWMKQLSSLSDLAIENKTFVVDQKTGQSWFTERWSEYIVERFPYYKDAGPMDWYILSFHATLEYIFNVGTGNIKATCISEMALFGLMMISGYIVCTIWILSITFRILVLMRSSKATYNFKIDCIRLYLQDVNISKEIMDNINEYFNILWQKKDGLKSAAHFNSLPTPLQMEIMYDLNCVYLNHSFLLYDLKEFYLRTLSLFMKHEFLLPGDILYHQGVVKTNLVIIMKGVLEILSDEDDESPIIAFQAGTVLGEACLFLSLPSKTTVRASVYTEVKLIDRVNFVRNISMYPIAFSYLRERILFRIRTMKNHITLNENTMLRLGEQDNDRIPIKILKDRLLDRQRKTRGLSKTRSSGHSEPKVEGGSKYTTKFCTQVLSLYQLSNEDSNVESPVICLTYNFPYILDSTCSLVKFLENLVIVIHCHFIFFYSYELTFMRTLSATVNTFMTWSDIISILDLILLTCTTVVFKDRVLKTFSDITRYRIKSFDFYVYIFSVLPLSYIMGVAISTSDPWYYRRILEVINGIKILRIQRCWSIFNSRVHHTTNIIYNIATTLLYLILTTYFFGCIFFLNSCFTVQCSEDSWYFMLMSHEVNDNVKYPSYVSPFFLSMYYAASTWLNVGVGAIKPGYPSDLEIIIPSIIIGHIIMIYLMSSLAANLYLNNTKSESFVQEVHSFQRFIKHWGVPLDLRQQVNKLFSLRWTCDGAIGRKQFRQLAPEHLQMVVYKADVMKVLNKVPLFQLVDLDFLMNIVLSSKITIFPSGATVCYSGDVDREMFIIQKGNCAIFDSSGTFVRHMKAGDYYGDIEMLFKMTKSGTLRTTTNCKIMLVTFRDFNSALSMFPTEMRVAHKFMYDNELWRQVDIIEQKRMISFMQMKPSELKQKRIWMVLINRIKNSFILAVRCHKKTGGREKYWDPFRKMGRWQIIGCFLMPITIHPNACILKFWITLRIILLLWMALILPRALGLPPATDNFMLMIMRTAERTAYLELYFFLHIGYYNKRGLLISHPKLTAIILKTDVIAVNHFDLPRCRSDSFISLGVTEQAVWVNICAFVQMRVGVICTEVPHKISFELHRNYLTHSFILDFIAAFPYYAAINILYPNHGDNLDPKIAHLVSHDSYCLWRCMAILQLYRVSGLIRYIREDVLMKKNKLTFSLLLVIIVAFIYVLTTLIITDCAFIFSATDEKLQESKNESVVIIFDEDEVVTLVGYITCDADSWIAFAPKCTKSAFRVIECSLYWFYTLFNKLGIGQFKAIDQMDKFSQFGLWCLGILMLSYVITMSSDASGKSSVLSLEYQHKVEELLIFLKREGLSGPKINKIFRYFEYVWKRTTGMENRGTIDELNSALKGDIALFLYEKTLREVAIFQKIARPYLKVLAKNLQEVYFLKSDNLIKCYDVHNSVYIIMRGKVDILTPYDELVTTIGVGGLFGNIHQAAPGCSSATFVAARNVDCLKMSSETFFLLAQEYPDVNDVLYSVLNIVGDYILPSQQKRRFHSFRSSDVFSQKYEESVYDEDIDIMSKSEKLEYKEEEETQEVVIVTEVEETPAVPVKAAVKEITVNIPKQPLFVCFLFLRPKYWFKFALEPNHKFFQYVRNATFVVTCYQAFIIPYVCASQNFNLIINVVSFTCEPIFYLRIFFFLHEAYLDVYGTYEKRFKMIVKNYLNDYKRICWDVIPNLPIYLFFLVAPPENHLYVRSILRLFQLLRIKYIYEAFTLWSAPLIANRVLLLLIKMLFNLLLFIHYCTLITLIVFSNFSKLNSENRELIRSGTHLEAYIFSLYFTCNFLSLTGLNGLNAETDIEIWMLMGFTASTKMVFASMTVFFTILAMILYQHVLNYEYKVTKLRKFLSNQGLSDHLMKKLWIYVKQMWKSEYGVHLPELLEDAPYVLRCEVMREIYSVHLRKGYLFKDINDALLTQICGHLKRIVFFKGNYIVQNGDTNASMYWIHRGEVSVLTVHPNLTETCHEMLYVHDMFGLAQGLNYGMPHKYSYRAETQCDILVLKLEAWESVLQHFPNDKDIIYKRMWNVYTIL